MSRAVLPELERAGGGSIVSIASNMAHVAAIGRTPYCTAKGGLVQFTKALALELATKKIRVNTVSPGGTLTERVIRRAGTEQAARDGAAKLHPMGRIGEAHEVAEAIFFMSSDAASFVTGTDLLVDGGYCAI
jgi:NAD(P)-dependent dehydrogenase (short-subunit alcohol dehydrogenase family)